MDEDNLLKYDGEMHYPDAIEDVQKVYSKWAPTYERDMIERNDVSNENVIKVSFDLIENEESTLMLDVGTGTGKSAVLFKEAGFKGHIDGIDMNPDMLAIALSKGVYRKTFRHVITEHDPLPVADGSYDVVISCASFMVNHIPAKSMRFMIKAVKSGGIFIFNSRLSKRNDAYVEKLLECASELVKEGKMELVKQQEVAYEADKTMSLVHVYRKT